MDKSLINSYDETRDCVHVFMLRCLHLDWIWRRTGYAVAAACQSHGGYNLKHTLLLCLPYSKQDHHLQNEHCAILKKTWNWQLRHPSFQLVPSWSLGEEITAFRLLCNGFVLQAFVIVFLHVRLLTFFTPTHYNFQYNFSEIHEQAVFMLRPFSAVQKMFSVWNPLSCLPVRPQVVDPWRVSVY